MLKILSLFTLALCLASCGGKAGKTTAKISFFKSSIAGIGTDADGGLMLWGRGPGEDFARVVDTSAPSLSFEVSNGTWTFWAVAWQSTTYNMDSIPKCAIANANFDGGDAAVELSLSNANCEASDFSIQAMNGVTGSKTFPVIDIVSCNQLSGITDETHHTSECSYAAGKKGYALSYEIVYPEYNGDAFTGVELASDCQVVPNTDANPTALFNSLPVPGNGSNPFGVIVRAWLDSTDCGTSNPEKGYIDDYFPLGLNQNQVAVRWDNSTVESIRFHQLTTELDICQDQRLETIPGSSPFASGRGDFRPYTICTEEQLNSIGENFPSYNASNFEQVADLSYVFNPFDPFVPIGDDIEANSVSTTTFTGNYEGRNHKVEGAFIQESDVSDLGFIRKMGGGFIKNLTLNSTIIESDLNGGAANNVALLIGNSVGTVIDNIKVHGHAKGEDNVGGLVGNLSGGGASFTINNSHAFISADGNQYVGGLVGTANAPTNPAFIAKSSANVDIHSNLFGVAKVGGLVGGITGAATATISESFSKGIIQGNQALGGIVGFTPTALNIVDSYSTASILSRHYTGGTDHRAGGLVGESTGTLNSMNITRSFATSGYQRGSTQGGNLNNLGGAVGKNGCAPTDAYFTGNDNSGTDGCGISKTLVQLHSSSTYASGSWTGNISFTDLTQTWVHLASEDGEDHPRLSWELKANPETGVPVEDEVPYLQRPCTGNYASMSGSGIEADPYQVCTVAQFLAMSTNTYYSLSKDIDLTDQASGTGSLFTVGTYFLDGNGKSIMNYNIGLASPSGYVGLFQALATSSVIEDLFIANFDIAVSGTPSGDLNIGLLTGSNLGTISGVEIEGASIGFNSSYFHPATDSVAIAGLTPFNGVTGVIQGTEVEADIRVQDSNLSNVNATDTFNVSGLVFQNDGLISEAVVSGYIELFSTTASNDSRDGVIFSSINNINNGTIEKVHSRMGVGVNNNNPSNIYATLGFGTNNGSISDIMLEGTFNLNNISSGSFNNYLMFGDNTSGNDIERLVASNSYSDHTMGIATGSTYGTNTGTADDLFCTEYTSNAFSTPLACALQSSAPTFSTTKAMALFSPVSPTANAGARAVDFGDIDGDGFQDMVVANDTNQTISVFIYNSGTDAFNAKADTNLITPGKDAIDLKVVDLDGDGDQDVVVGTMSLGSPKVIWLENTDGAGTFTSADIFTTTGAMKKVDVADYNGDGTLDVAVLLGASIDLLDNDGAQSFSNSTIASFSDGVDFVSGDFDNDGLIDVVVSEGSFDQVKFIKNASVTTASAATWNTAINSTTGSTNGAAEIDLGDINEDGFLDLAVVIPGAGESMIMLGDGAGNFAGSYRFSGADDIKIRDTNGDTYLDVLIVNSSTGEVEAIKGTGTPYFEQSSIYNCTGCAVVDATDLTGDGYAEAIGLDAAGSIRHFENQGYVIENLVSTSSDVATTSWDIHQFPETSLDDPYSVTADWHIYEGELEPGWSEGPDASFEAGVFP